MLRPSRLVPSITGLLGCLIICSCLRTPRLLTKVYYVDNPNFWMTFGRTIQEPITDEGCAEQFQHFFGLCGVDFGTTGDVAFNKAERTVTVRAEESQLKYLEYLLGPIDGLPSYFDTIISVQEN